MKTAKKLFYLVGDPATAHWVETLNPTAETLANSFSVGRNRMESYNEIVERVIKTVRMGLRVTLHFMVTLVSLSTPPTKSCAAHVRKVSMPRCFPEFRPKTVCLQTWEWTQDRMDAKAMRPPISSCEGASSILELR